MPREIIEPLEHQTDEGPYLYRGGDLSLMPSAHCEAIGRFMVHCAQLEGRALSLVSELLGGDRGVVRFFMARTKMHEVPNLLKGVARRKEWAGESRKDLHLILTEIDYVFQVRNWVAHGMASWNNERIRFDDSFTSKNEICDVYAVTPPSLVNIAHYATILTHAIAALVVSHVRPGEWNHKEYLDALQRFYDQHMLPAHPKFPREERAPSFL